MTQVELGQRAGMSPSMVHAVENEAKWPSDDTIEAIAKALDIHPTLLFSEAHDVPESKEEAKLRAYLKRKIDQLPAVMLDGVNPLLEGLYKAYDIWNSTKKR